MASAARKDGLSVRQEFAVIPQDTRSPYRQARSVEAVNSGGSDIPPHGVVEVVGNELIESEFRDALSVRQPSKKGLPRVAVNGPVTIPAGGRGFVTLDGPMYVKASSSLQNGQMAGTDGGSFGISKGYPGFVVLGDGPNGTYRVEWLWCPVLRATLGASLCPDETTASISNAWASDKNLDVTTADNVFKLAGENGAPCELSWNGKTEKWELLQVAHRTQKVVTRVYDDGACAIKEDYLQKVSLMYCETALAENVATFTEVEAVTGSVLADSVSGSGSSATGGCSFKLNTTKLCVLKNNGAGTQQVAMNFEAHAVMKSLRVKNNCIEGYIEVVYVPCSGDAEWIQLFCGTTCSSGSG